MHKDVDVFAKKIWDYMQLGHVPSSADLIFLLGNNDPRTALRAAELYKQGISERILISGKGTPNDYRNKSYQHSYESEAEAFAEVITDQGVPESALLLEKEAMNTGQNIEFGQKALVIEGLSPTSVVLVQKPYMERRTFATFMAQWQGDVPSIQVTSPQIAYDQYFDSEKYTKEYVVNVMVGDMQRIKEYPKKGFQIDQDIPEDVWLAYEGLVELGYDRNLIENG